MQPVYICLDTSGSMRGEPIAAVLKKQGGNFGKIIVNLNWNQTPKGGRSGGAFGLFSGKSGIDLDLGCMFETPKWVQGCSPGNRKFVWEFSRRQSVSITWR